MTYFVAHIATYSRRKVIQEFTIILINFNTTAVRELFTLQSFNLLGTYECK